MNTFNLEVLSDNAKSYCNKAKVIENNDNFELISYNTLVCRINANRTFDRTWDGYSATTLRHVNSFRYMFSMPKLSKKEWESIVVSEIRETL